MPQHVDRENPHALCVWEDVPLVRLKVTTTAMQKNQRRTVRFARGQTAGPNATDIHVMERKLTLG
jgi:hypothetical protein